MVKVAPTSLLISEVRISPAVATSCTVPLTLRLHVHVSMYSRLAHQQLGPPISPAIGGTGTGRKNSSSVQYLPLMEELIVLHFHTQSVDDISNCRSSTPFVNLW